MSAFGRQLVARSRLIWGFAAILVYVSPAVAQQETCASIYESLFDSIERELDRDDPSLDAIQWAGDRVPEYARCSLESVVPFAARSKYLATISAARGFDRMGRPYPLAPTIRLKKERITVIAWFDSDGHFRRRLTLLKDQYTDELPISMTASECLDRFKGLIVLIEEGLSVRRNWYDLNGRLRAQLPLANCPADEVRSAVRNSKVFEREGSVGPTGEFPTRMRSYSFWFRRGNDRLYVDLNASLERGGLAFRTMYSYAKPF
jgi:hypothetical protein